MAADPAALLRRVPLFAGVNDATLAGLTGRLRRRTYRRGTMIFHKDQPGEGLHVIESGRVRFFLPAEAGEELTIDVAGPGEVFGELALLDGQPRSASAESLEETVTYVLGREEFQATLAASPELAAALIGLLSTRLRHVTDYAESLVFLDVHARVARALLELAGRYGVRGDAQGITIDLELTQTDLATMVGATRERVNRALAAFREQGLVELRGRQIMLRDPDRLRLRIY